MASKENSEVGNGIEGRKSIDVSHKDSGSQELKSPMSGCLRLKKSISDLCCEMALTRLSHGLKDGQSPLPQILATNARLSSKLSQRSSIREQQDENKNRKRLEEYERMPSYIRENDWKIDESKGGAILYNKEKKSIISKLIGYICKRVLSSGSFMGISFPTFGMKAQSMLETYCKCLGAVPVIMQNVSEDPVERIKAFNAIILTFSLQFNDIEKPFNPTLGETFQGEIAGNKVYAEQICHHPPISSFLFEGKDYTLHATLELSASLGVNSAVGMFFGDFVLQFKDGGIVKGRQPCGSISGMMLGDTKFLPQGAVYSYDPINKLVCSYNVKSKDIFVGQIGKLLPTAEESFFKKVNSKNKEIYTKFDHIPEGEFQVILSRMEAIWSKQISYDGNVYINYKEPKSLPIKMTQNIQELGQNLLKSDSSWREDIKLRANLRMEESQKEKERIEDEERAFRKLRENGTKK